MVQTAPRIRIAVDAMGGDHAPGEIVRGVVRAAKNDRNMTLILVGPVDVIREELSQHDIAGLDINCVHAGDFVKEAENPAIAVWRRPNCSISVASNLVKHGEADALLGATATGSLVAAAIQYLGMLDGIDRPVIGGVLSGLAPRTITLDLGVNTDCKPEHLVNFAVIGTVYAKTLLDIHEPRVALLNIGQEAEKGNQTTRAAYILLEKSGLNFIGNLEGDEILSGRANVIVCDGFTGNSILKFTESAGRIIDEQVNRHLASGAISGDDLKESIGLLPLPGAIGGGVLWGIDGLVAKTHGNSRANMVAGRLGQVKRAAERDVVGHLKIELSRIREKLDL